MKEKNSFTMEYDEETGLYNVQLRIPIPEKKEKSIPENPPKVHLKMSVYGEDEPFIDTILDPLMKKVP